jgi:hypothetical protein
VLGDIKGMSIKVGVTKEQADNADIYATSQLLELYTEEGVFKCPRCPFTTKDQEKAVYHLAEEINKALTHLAKRSK